mgnify:FL=1
MNKRIECTVSGRVQMVMYRDFVTRSARKLGIVGEVWNERDGTVRIVAEGDEERLNLLIKLLHKGSLLARVEAVTVDWKEQSQTYHSFTIRYT